MSKALDAETSCERQAMTEAPTTTWYQLEADYTGKGFKIVPLQVISQTAKTILMLESWGATHWQKAGSRTRRKVFNGDQFDSKEAAYDAGIARLTKQVEQAANRVKTVMDELETFRGSRQ